MYQVYQYKYSSFLKKIFYMESGGYLCIELKNGGKCEYNHVPAYIVDNLKNERIANSVFKNSKILKSCLRKQKNEQNNEEKAYKLAQIRDIIDLLN